MVSLTYDACGIADMREPPSVPRRRIAQTAFVLLAAVLLAGALAVVAASDLQDAEFDDPADQIYLDGDEAILVFEEPEDDDDVREAFFGADATTGLAHAVVDLEPDDEVEGSLGMELTPDRFQGDGDLTVDRPDEFEDLSMLLEFVHTGDQSTFDGEFDLLLAQPFPIDATTDGEWVTTHDRMAFDADFAFDMDMGVEDPGAVHESLHVEIESTATGFVVEYHEVEAIGQFGPHDERIETEDGARTALEEEFDMLAAELGGSADLTLHDHDYQASEQGEDRYEVDYTLKLTGASEGIGQLLADGMEDDPAVDLSPAEREEIAESAADIEVESIVVSFDETDTGMTGSLSADVRNWEAFWLATMGGMADGEFLTEEDIEEFQANLAAMEAADMQQVITWNVETTDAATGLGITGTMHYDAENWEAYVDEAEDRGVRGVDEEVTATFSIETPDDIELAIDFDVADEDLVEDGVTLIRESMAADPDVDEEALQFVRALEEAEFGIAKLDADFAGDEARMEMGVYFEDATALGEEIGGLAGAPIEHIYGESDGEDTVTYVYLQGVDADEEAFRNSPLADDDTEFVDDVDGERMDIEAAAEYLGVDVDVPEEDGPGMTAVTAIAALLGTVGLLAARKRMK